MKLKREYFFLFLIFLIFFALFFKLFSLQILEQKKYSAFSFAIFASENSKEKKRGEIYFSGGEPLAINKEIFEIIIFPEKIKEKEKISEILANFLDKEKEKEILNKLKNQEKISFEIEDEKIIEEIKRKNLEGVFFTKKQKRVYPQKEVAFQVIGFLGGEGKGQYGIEEFYEKELSEGKDLKLTLDFQIQFMAEKILEKEKEKLNFEKGGILVLDPQDGKILAMAVYPRADPNNYKQYAKNLEIFKNFFTQEIYEPGSVFKPVTMAIGLEEGKITPETTYRDPGKIKIDGWIITNYDNRQYPGEISMTEVLEKSINTGAVFVQQKIPKEVHLKYLEKFGVFEKTNIDLPEIVVSNSELKKMRDITFATISFGQGIALTPIQLARIFSALVNGGKLITPHLNSEFRLRKEVQVLSKETSEKLQKMLISVVENGFAKRAKIPGYFIGGKTGTALQPIFGGKGYSHKSWQSFVGFFPAFSPNYLILVKLDDPKTKTAEYSAVPIFKEMADFIIKLKQIPPDYSPNENEKH
jgi:stage V sporulation protein D (sporulation-specific penicillin-binding protein)